MSAEAVIDQHVRLWAECTECPPRTFMVEVGEGSVNAIVRHLLDNHPMVVAALGVSGAIRVESK